VTAWRRWLLATCVAAVAVHVAVVYAAPHVIMRIAMRRIAAESGWNSALFGPRADAAARTVVRPSPDLLYSTCVFDVTQRPVRITADIPKDTYWSVSMFTANTDNFFKLNDREVSGRIDLVLAKAGTAVSLPAGARLVEAPTALGLVLTRTLITDERRATELDQARRAFACAPL